MSFCNRQICPECGGEDCELAQEVARLKAALKPVLECPRICFMDIVNGNSRDAINAVINAKRIYKEGEEK